MRPDILEYRDFYDSALGALTRRLLRRELRRLWPNVRGDTVLGLGYATPYLAPFAEAARLIALMPATQGVTRWPRRGPAAVALTEDTELPLRDKSIDRVILIHEMEMTFDRRPLLRELWRVLADDGRILVVVPNRSGLWARSDATPFGSGQPFNAAQIRRLLRDAMFEPGRLASVLYMPPNQRRFMLKSQPAWEYLGSRLAPRFAGVLVIEAAKCLYAPNQGGTAVRLPVKLLAPQPLASSRSTVLAQ